MDSLTQAALGGTLGYAIGGRHLGRKAALWGMGLGTLPDLDVLVSFADPIENFIYHRSWSHSLLLLTAISPLLAETIRRLHKLPASARLSLIVMTWLILITHPLLDSLTSYGTQLLWPLTNTPYAVSSISIIDPIYTLPLLFALLWALIRGKPDLAGHLDRISKACVAALLLSSLYLGWGMMTQNRIEARITQQIQQEGPALDLQQSKLLVTPALGSSLLWYVLVVDDEKARYGWVSLLGDNEKPVRWSNIERNVQLLGQEASQPELVKALTRFTHGFYALEQQEDSQILVKDLRMGIAPDFVFRFIVARQTNEQLQWLQPSQQLQRQINPEAASLLWSRMLGR